MRLDVLPSEVATRVLYERVKRRLGRHLKECRAVGTGIGAELRQLEDAVGFERCFQSMGGLDNKGAYDEDIGAKVGPTLVGLVVVHYWFRAECGAI